MRKEDVIKNCVIGIVSFCIGFGLFYFLNQYQDEPKFNPIISSYENADTRTISILLKNSSSETGQVYAEDIEKIEKIWNTAVKKQKPIINIYVLVKDQNKRQYFPVRISYKTDEIKGIFTEK